MGDFYDFPEYYSRESIGEAVSFLISRYCELYKIERNKCFWINAKELTSSMELGELILLAAKRNMIVEWEVSMDYYGYDIDYIEDPERDADYVIVLGAQVRGTRITKSLRYRLDIALEYLEENPSAKVIVSGGQGSGEDISEAAAMKGYLIERGLEAERILLEDRSVNTAENIRFSKELIEADGGSEEASVVIATNSFHVFRALRIAAKQGLTQVSGLSARNDQILMASYYVRECLAIIKDFLWGNI